MVILSPSFFNVYMDDLSVLLSKCQKECNINNMSVNHMFYADDSIIMGPSPTALQELLNICYDYACTVELKYNVKKTVCMLLRPKWLKDLKTPNLLLGGMHLDFKLSQKYLGCYISEDFTDDCDIKRMIRSVYCRGNILIKKFRHCSDDVKVKLFKSYCSSFYGCTLWSNFKQNTMSKLVVAYKQIFRCFFHCKRTATTFQMLNFNIDSYAVILRKLIFSLKERIFNSSNTIVNVITNAMFFYSSGIFKQWLVKLYSVIS